VLPALPAVLLLVARHYPRLSERARRAPALACIASGMALGVLAVALPRWGVLQDAAFESRYSLWLFAAALTLIAAGCAALVLFRRDREETVLAILGLGSMLAMQISLSGTHVLDERYSSERLVESVAGEKLRFSRNPPFYSVATFDQSVPFYLGRPVTLVDHKDELAPGIAAEPGKYIESIDEFVRRWGDDAEAFAIMQPQLYEKLRRQGLPGRVMARDARLIIIARRSARHRARNNAGKCPRG
jgi:hypothetical protein